MDFQEVDYAVADGVATITLNRPQARNGYTVRMADELAYAFGKTDADPDVRVVVLTGAGSDFCVGADLSGGSLDVGEGDESWQEPAGRCVRAIFASTKPVIAAIRGAAVGAGSTIILPADFRLAATDSRFGFVFSRRGLYPEGASTWFLPRLVGLGRALDWMVSGRVFGADEALAAGLVTRLHEPDEVLPAAYELAAELAAKVAPVAAAVIRQMLFRLSPLESPDPVHRLDSRLIAQAAGSDDTVEGVRSFLERRDPQFPGVVPDDIPAWLPWQSD
ncbi:enoyl-CoA hydratase-related protein [Thermocrispum municipale]|jgi:enoyl-CoA hydratase/carnithine racemase|uniref:enoyl-CoA hydratase-related protein n=1 Tax=Thermocrispum municipale TaxID=37926 RepID=UPI0004038969|nr:enoyl-CoA hydratase-related protein [Thermocrispum municipale]